MYVIKGDPTCLDEIKHLGSFLIRTLTDKRDCQFKISSFIGQVNKLNSNFGRVSKAYCCSFHGSQVWAVNKAGY